jgi:co-chaperonin GroES (HSP10)
MSKKIEPKGDFLLVEILKSEEKSNIEGVLIPDNSKGLLVEAVVLAIPSGLCMGFDVGNTVIIYKQKGLPYKGKLFIDHSDVVASLGD